MADTAVNVWDSLAIGPGLASILRGGGLMLVLVMAKVLLRASHGLMLTIARRARPNGLQRKHQNNKQEQDSPHDDEYNRGAQRMA